MLRNKESTFKTLNPKFSVTQEKQTRDIESLLEMAEQSGEEIATLKSKVALLTSELGTLKQQMQTLVALAGVKGNAH